MKLDRASIAILILGKLKENFELLQQQFSETDLNIGYFLLDDLLPAELATKLYRSFPTTKTLTKKKNIREYKYVSAQMNQYHALLEETLFAFQNKEVVQLISQICQLPDIYPDASLYAGGVSLMEKGNYLKPHLDNSHDKDRKLWRVLNLLYYVTPNWQESDGGVLELWEEGIKSKPITIFPAFNRLVVMATHQKSWHSVSRIEAENRHRTCISNYYFSDKQPILSKDFHVTTFRNPEEKMEDIILRTDNTLRGYVRKVMKKGVRKTRHLYKKKD